MGQSESSAESTSATEAKKRTTREQILQAALTCFADKGYHKATMDDIVAESGMSKGSLYWHFKSKQDLFVSLIDWFMFEIIEETSHAWTEEMSAAEKIRAGIMVFVDNFEQFMPFYKIIMDFWAQAFEQEQVLHMFDDYLEQFIAQLVPIIEEGVASGEFRSVDASHAALALVATFDAIGLYRVLLGEKIDVQGTMETTLDLMLTGLKS